MSEDVARAGLAIGELVARTGVSEGRLRMWERRHDFPTPERLPSGHRRYSEGDVERVQRVLRERAAGLSLVAAIARVLESEMDVEPSIFAGLRRRRPELQPFVLRKPAMLALSRAIEDESCARAEWPLLFGSFQEERFYRQSERRWRDFSRTAELTCVFADFDRVRLPADGPAELPIDANGPLLREWAVVCEARGHAVCLAGVELPAVEPRRDSEREFEVIWSVEPAAVRVASDVCAGLAARAAPELADRLEARASFPPAGPPAEDQLRLAAMIITRALSQLA